MESILNSKYIRFLLHTFKNKDYVSPFCVQITKQTFETKIPFELKLNSNSIDFANLTIEYI